MSKRFVALARVSSREQEREGFSLDVQEEALQRYAKRNGGQIVQLYQIAETASKRAERKTFKELLIHVRKHAKTLSGLLFYKVDRAARNLFDYVELERLETDYGVPVVYVTQPTENSPAGRMQRRILANMASFYTEQQSLDVKEGQQRRVSEGLFPCKAPFGYRNVRVDGRGLVEVDETDGPKVQRVFELYAYRSHTLDALSATLRAECISYSDDRPMFPRSKLHAILRDRSYIGEVLYQGQWHPGSHEPLVDVGTFHRVQVLLGEKVYNSHESVYGSGMIKCGHCGRPVVVEIKSRNTRKGRKQYVYYRCARYNGQGHPSIRVKESELDRQVFDLFDRLKVANEKVHAWVVKVLRAKSREHQRIAEDRSVKLQRELGQVRQRKDRLLNMRLADEIDAETFGTKHTQLRDREAEIALQMEGQGRQESERADLVVRVFELSQSLREKWLAADIAEKRQLLEIVCLNFTLDGVTLDATMRKPFDVLAEGLSVQPCRGDWI